jgi:hypothetical protein
MICCIPPNSKDGTRDWDEPEEEAEENDREFGDEQLARNRKSGRMARNFIKVDISDC